MYWGCEVREDEIIDLYKRINWDIYGLSGISGKNERFITVYIFERMYEGISG